MRFWLSSLLNDEASFHSALCWSILGSGALTFVALLFITAPYGKHSTSGWGPAIGAKASWFFMEGQSIWVSLICLSYARNEASASLPNMILLSMFIIHYVNRSIIYPSMMINPAPVPLSIALMAAIFCSVNGYLQARQLCTFQVYESSWLYDPRFIIGTCIWAHGFCLNIQADGILRSLRRSGGNSTERYKIPRGGLFEYVSGANYAAEIWEWIGFALATWSLPGFTFAVFTFCNTAPRGVSSHKWYLEKFKDYPKGRKGVIPFVW